MNYITEKVLKAVKALGLATFSGLENETKETTNKLRWALNELKTAQLVKQTEDTSNNEIAFRISPKGQLYLDGRLAQKKKMAKVAEILSDHERPCCGTLKGSPHRNTCPNWRGKKAPAKAKPEHVVRACATPAAGGANISSNPESVSHVVADSTSPEVRAVVVEQQKPDEMPVSASSNDIAASPKNTTTRDIVVPPFRAEINMKGELALHYGRDHFFIPKEDVPKLADFLVQTIDVWQNRFTHLLPERKIMQQITLPTLADGEIYVGAIGDASGNLHHVILLPGDNDDATHQAQLEWAKSIGGDLPTRVEQAMLWANHRDQFKTDWYWSNDIHHSESGWAWSQDFISGYQSTSHRLYELRARAVRRLPI